MIWPHKAEITHTTETTTIGFQSAYRRMMQGFKYEINLIVDIKSVPALERDYIGTYRFTCYTKNFHGKFEELETIKGFADWTSAFIAVFNHFDSQMRPL